MDATCFGIHMVRNILNDKLACISNLLAIKLSMNLINLLVFYVNRYVFRVGLNVITGFTTDCLTRRFLLTICAVFQIKESSSIVSLNAFENRVIRPGINLVELDVLLRTYLLNAHS